MPPSQLSTMPLNISQWEPEADYGGVFPKGAREKSVYYSPDDVSEYPYLKPNFRYLFKESFDRYPDQFWAEIIAFKVGSLMGVKVPPTFVSYKKIRSEIICGSLIEWFYDEKSPLFVSYFDGGALLGVIIPDFDQKRGTKHNFKDIMKLFSNISKMENFELDKTWANDWLKIITFDTIIGNTDRHQNNWGVITTLVPGEKKYVVSISPAFDNGTSMGHEIVPHKLINFKSESRLITYINKGLHHMRWQLGEDRMSHLDFMKRVFNNIPKSAEFVLELLDFDISTVESEINSLKKFIIPIPLANIRADFILNLICKRVELLSELAERSMA